MADGVVIVGLDPGVRETGVAIWHRATQTLEVHGLSGRKVPELVKRAIDLPVLFKAERSLYEPRPVFAIEDQRYVQRGKTEAGETNFAASAVRDLQMALAGAAYACGWPVVFVQPVTAKAGVGARKKGDVIRAVEARFKLRGLTSNQADAVAIALAGESAYRLLHMTGAA